MKEFTLVANAPADVVLEAIRGEARESALPADMRRKGLTRMIGRVRPPFFRVWLHAPGGRNELPHTIRGVVVEGPAGVTRIRGEYGRRMASPRATAIGLAVFVAIAATVGGAELGAMSFVLAAGVAMMMLILRSATLRPGREEEYLMERLSHAIETAEKKAALPPPGPPAAIPASRAAAPNSPARTPWKRP